MATSRSSHPAFTLVELLIVVVIIVILATLAIVAYKGVQDRARGSAAQSDLSQAAKQLAVDKVLTGSYPSDTGSANGGKGLKASTGTTYQYTVDNTTGTFCLSAVNGTQGYHITNGGAPEADVCPGHTPPGGGSVALVCNTGFIPVPGNSTFGTSDFCVAKYEAKNVGGVAVSQAAGTPWVSITQTSAITTAQAACSGCHLITDAEWLTIAHNVLNVASNWSGGVVGSGYIYSGNNDTSPATALAASTDDNDGYSGTGNSGTSSQRRTLTLSNGQVIWDFPGNVWEWTSGQVTSGQPGGSGFAWREWKDVTIAGSLSPNPFPAFGTPAASGWTGSGNGISQLFSDSSSSALVGFRRGGSWGDSSYYAGVFDLNLGNGPATASNVVGFRIAK